MLNQTIPFEMHITTADLSTTQIGLFVEVCVKNDGKPLLIELSQGEYVKQPMFSKVIYANNMEVVIDKAFDYSHLLKENGFPTKRVKIEIPSTYAESFREYRNAAFEPYFEWHGKIPFHQVSQLLELCSTHKVHLSLNALKDESATRFITLRELGTKEIFQQRLDALISDLQQGSWQILKQQSEYCLYDTNTLLDKGWLPH